jgi:hypothetical protein
MPPGKWYLNTIRRGYRDFGLDETYLDEAVRSAWERKDVTEALHARWLRSGRQELAEMPEPLQTVIELPFLDVDKGEGEPAAPAEVPQAEPAVVEHSGDNAEKDLPASTDAGK